MKTTTVSCNSFSHPSNGQLPQKFWAAIYLLVSLMFFSTGTAQALPNMTSPVPGATFSSVAVTFQWDLSGFSSVGLKVGAIQGGDTYFSDSFINDSSQVVYGLPNDGSQIWVRLSWQGKPSGYQDYSYTAYGGVVHPRMTSPASGSTFDSTSITFTWNEGDASQFNLSVGNSQGGSDYFNGKTLGTSLQVSGLPNDGRQIWTRLSYSIGSGGAHQDYNYTALDTAIAIPDTVFKSFLVAHYDMNNDGEITISEARAVWGILNTPGNIGNPGLISNLSGIQYFINITELDCSFEQLTTLPDLSNLTKLKRLNCSYNSLDKLIGLSELVELEYLQCNNNLFTDLPGLRYLDKLIHFACGNNSLTALEDLADLTDLEYLDCTGNSLKGLVGIGALSKLKILYCGGNSITELPAPLSNLTSLERFSCAGNLLSEMIYLGNLTNLIDFNCSINSLDKLPGLSNLTNLRTLRCSNNGFTQLPDLSSLVNLTGLYCYRNLLSELPDLSPLVNLTSLYCDTNFLKEMPDLTANTSIDNFWIFGNQIDEESCRAIQTLESQNLNIFVYNPQRNGKIINCEEIAAIPGDINDDNGVDLKDVILSLQITTGPPPGGLITNTADINGDDQIGLAETVYILDELYTASLPILPPADLRAIPVNRNSEAILLSWTDTNRRRTSYTILRQTDGSGGYVEIATTADGSILYQDSGLEPCTSYSYRVRASRNEEQSDYVEVSSRTAPGTPTNLLASPGTVLDQVRLTWTEATCAASYKVYRLSDYTQGYTLLRDQGEITGSVAFDLKPPSTMKYYYYRVSAIDQNGVEGGLSCTVGSETAPRSGATFSEDTCQAAIGWAASPAPTGLWASQGNYTDRYYIGWNSSQLSWNIPGFSGESWAQYYRLYYMTNNNQWIHYQDLQIDNSEDIPISTVVGASPGTQITWTVTAFYQRSLGNGITCENAHDYYYNIFSCDSSTGVIVFESSKDAIQVDASTASDGGSTSSQLPAPSLLTNSYYPGAIMLGWSSIEGADSYEIYRSSTDRQSGFQLHRTVSGSVTRIYDATVVPWTDYWYRVRAINSINIPGEWSPVEYGNASELPTN